MRLTADKVFGEESFCNEISWCHGGNPVECTDRRLSHFHGRILVYGEIINDRCSELLHDGITMTDFWQDSCIITRHSNEMSVKKSTKEKPLSVVSWVI